MRTKRLRQRHAGVACIIVGLIATVASVSAPSASASTSSPICNQQNSETTCPGNEHGTATATILGDGSLEFHMAGASGYTWKEIFVCVPYPGQGRGADCNSSSDNDGDYTDGEELLQPGTDYTVTGATGVTNGNHSATFDCDDDFRATVKPAVVEAQPNSTFKWALHLTPCGGGSDEAFGSSDK